MKNVNLAAEYITAPASFKERCPVFRRTFDGKDVKKAELKISALGLYEAVLNKKRVGDFIFAPGWTAYESRLQVQSYDITDLIRNHNTLDVTVGKGWCGGNIGWEGKSGHWSKTPALIAEITLTKADGSVVLIGTDNHWKAAKSPILMSEIYHGETFDANVVPRFSYDAQPYKHPKSILIPQEGEIVREQETFALVKTILTPEGDTVLDFGQELTGYIRAEGELPKGAVLEYDHAEVLDRDGNFYTANLRSAKQTVRYTAAGGAFCYKPHFSFQGFRYVRVKQGLEFLSNVKFTAVAVYSDLKRTGRFECSDPLINRLYENVVWSQRGNFLDVPTDCPQRDERLGWLGDAQVFIGTAAYNYNVEKFFRKWMHDLSAVQYPNGNMPHVCPSYFCNEPNAGAWGNSAAGWGDAAVVCPWKIYLAYGNKAVLSDQFDCMKNWIEFMRREGDHEYLWETGTAFGDWLGLDSPEGSYHGATDEALIGTAFFAYSTSILIKAGRVLGKDMSSYETLYQNIVRTFGETYITAPGRLKGDTQTAYVLALHFDLVADKKPYIDRLAELIEQNGRKLKTGFIGTAYLLQTLSENGRHDLAYSLLLQQEFPSWLYAVNMGATTIWEHWDGMRPDGTMWSTHMNSFNHYAYGVVAEWMYSVMGGIKPDEAKPGYEHILIAPAADRRISWAKVSYETKRGTVTSAWRHLENGKTLYEITVPEGAAAAVTLGGKTEEVEAGNYRYEI